MAQSISVAIASDQSKVPTAIWSNTVKDGSGTAYQPLLDASGHLQVDVLSGGGSGADPVGLKNVALATINPATEDTLALIKSTDGIKKIVDSVTVTNAGTFAVQATLAAETTKVIGTVNQGTSPWVVGQGTAANLNMTEASALAIKTAVELIDNSVDGNYLNVNMNLAGTDAPSGAGTEAGVLRVTIANDSTGVLSVDDNGGTLTVDNAGTFVVQDSQVIADDAALTVGISKVFQTGFFADDASPDSVNEGDVGVPRMSLDRIVYVEPPFGIGTTGTTDCTNVSTGYRITTSSTRVHNFRLQAKGSNQGTITWGWSSTYASNYFELRPGGVVNLGDIDISLLYFGSTFAGDDINYSYTI